LWITVTWMNPKPCVSFWRLSTGLCKKPYTIN
jgi:hypothetical protein